MMNTLNRNGLTPEIPIVVLKLDGTYVATYSNISDCSYKLGLGMVNINNFFSGHQCRVKDYIFVKQSEYDPTRKYTYEGIKKRRKFLKSKTTKR